MKSPIRAVLFQVSSVSFLAILRVLQTSEEGFWKGHRMCKCWVLNHLNDKAGTNRPNDRWHQTTEANFATEPRLKMQIVNFIMRNSQSSKDEEDIHVAETTGMFHPNGVWWWSLYVWWKEIEDTSTVYMWAVSPPHPVLRGNKLSVGHLIWLALAWKVSQNSSASASSAGERVSLPVIN